jgi:hypothetical protein
MLTEKEFILLTQALHDLAENQDCTIAESTNLLSKIKDLNYAYVTKIKKEHSGIIPNVLL